MKAADIRKKLVQAKKDHKYVTKEMEKLGKRSDLLVDKITALEADLADAEKEETE